MRIPQQPQSNVFTGENIALQNDLDLELALLEVPELERKNAVVPQQVIHPDHSLMTKEEIEE